MYVPIDTVSSSAPTRVVAPGHGLVDGWRAGIMDIVGGLSPFNITQASLLVSIEQFLMPITVIDADIIEFSRLNSASVAAHTAGTGHLVYYRPLDISAYTSARSDLKVSVNSPPALSFTTEDGTYELSPSTSSLILRPAINTPMVLDARKYVFDIELVTAGGQVLAPVAATSEVTILPEVTTT